MDEPGTIISRPHDQYPAEVSTGKVRFVLVSDTHSCPSWNKAIPDGDVFIHAGDLTLGGTKEQIEVTYRKIKNLPHKIKLVIAGNHDLGMDKDFMARHSNKMKRHGSGVNRSNQALLRRMWNSREATAAGLIFLDHEATTINIRGRAFNVFGSPYSPEFFDWAYMYPVDEDIWSPASKATIQRPGGGVPDNTDILITHGPPFGVLDQIANIGPVGCRFLLKRLGEVQPALHVFGHIHEGAEQGLLRKYFGGGNGRETISVNAAVLDEHYRLSYRPTVIDL